MRMLSFTLLLLLLVGISVLIWQARTSYEPKEQDGSNSQQEDTEKNIRPVSTVGTGTVQPHQTTTTDNKQDTDKKHKGFWEWFESSDGATWLLVFVGIIAAIAALRTI